MTPDQRHDKLEAAQRNTKVSSLIKGSIQTHEKLRVHEHPQQNYPSPLTSTAVHTDFKTEQQQSKITKDSLVYSAGDDEKAGQLQKSALSGLSEDQLSSHLVSDEHAFLRHPTFENSLRPADPGNIQIQDFSKPQEIGKQIIQEALPANNVAMDSQSLQAAAFKKSSNRLSQAEATVATSSKRELPPLAPVADTFHHTSLQSRIQETNTVVAISTQEQRASPVQRLTLGSIPFEHEKIVTFKPMTAAPQSEPAVTLVSSTGHSTPSEQSQRTDRLMKQYQPLVQMPVQLPQPQIKPTTSSLLSGKLATTHQQELQPNNPSSPVVFSSTGAQHYHTIERRGDPATEQNQRTSRTQGRVLELRSSREHHDQVPKAAFLPEEPVHITRTVAATPEILEYVRTHSGQLPQDTIVTHPPKLIAEYTVDADGNRIQLSKTGANPDSGLKIEGVQTQTRISSNKPAPRPAEHDQRGNTAVREEQRIIAPNPQPRSFGEERVHQIKDEVIIENKPYIIEPKSGKKIYIDPNNLSQYVPLFQKQAQQSSKTQEQIKVMESQLGVKSVLRTSGRAISTQAAIPPEQSRHPNLSPNTQVVRVPQTQTESQKLDQQSQVGQHGKNTERRVPQQDEASRSRSRHHSHHKRVKISEEQQTATADAREGQAELDENQQAKSHRSHRKHHKKDRENVIRIPMDQAEEFLANYHKKQREATELDLFTASADKQQWSRIRHGSAGQDGYSLAPGIQKVGGQPASGSNRRLESGGKVPKVEGGGFTGREVAQIKIEARPLEERRVLGQGYESCGYRYEGSAPTGWPPSTRYVQPGQLASWSGPGDSRGLQSQSQSPSSGLGVAAVVRPGLVHTALPHLHTLPSPLHIHHDIDSTLHRIINRAFN